MTSLKKLRLGYVRDETLGGITGLKNLEDLAFYSGLGDEGLKHVGQLTSLRELSVSNTRISDTGLKHLTGLKNLPVCPRRTQEASPTTGWSPSPG